MLEGELAGLNTVKFVTGDERVNERIHHLKEELHGLRAGPVGEKIRYGLAQLFEDSVITSEKIENQEHDITDLAHTGVPAQENINEKMPDALRMNKPYAVIECFQEIPCNPCVTSCPFDAIFIPKEDINRSPVVDFDKCTGCMSCISGCPGLAIFVEHRNPEQRKGTVSIPFEMLNRPQKGDVVDLLARDGQPLGTGVVRRVLYGQKQDKTAVITVETDIELVNKARNIQLQGTNKKGVM